MEKKINNDLAIVASQYLEGRFMTQPEVTVHPKFNGRREAVVGFINACHLYARARLGGAGNREKIS